MAFSGKITKIDNSMGAGSRDDISIACDALIVSDTASIYKCRMVGINLPQKSIRLSVSYQVMSGSYPYENVPEIGDIVVKTNESSAISFFSSRDSTYIFSYEGGSVKLLSTSGFL